MTRRLLAANTLLAICLAACATTDPTIQPSDVDATDLAPTSMASSDEGMASPDDTPASESTVAGDFSHPVLQANATRPDGSSVTIADFAGQTVFVETFATWCSKCRRQLGDTNEAAAQAPDDVVFLVLSVEDDLDPAKLASYQEENGFGNVAFAVLSAEGLAAFNDQFGRTILNAPSTPKFIVAADGTLSEMTTGFESPDEILAQLA